MEKVYYSYTEVDKEGKSPRPLYRRFIDDVGYAFAAGMALGSPFYFLEGIYKSPNGQRLARGSRAACVKAPRLGGLFALYNSVFSATQCTAIHVRQKHDSWNPILAWASVGGFFNLHRRRLVPASGAALCYGICASLSEGFVIFMNRELSSIGSQSLRAPSKEMLT